MNLPEAAVRGSVTQILGARPDAWTPVTERGYANNTRWLVHIANGTNAFVKVATDNRTAAWLRTEHRVYAALQQPFLPRLIGWLDDGDRPVLVLECLQSGIWPPPWSTSSVSAVLQSLGQISGVEPPADLPQLESYRRNFASWSRVREDPLPFLGLQLCSTEWLERALPVLLKAEQAAKLTGDRLVHFDVRSDNIFIRGEQALLIDWNFACIGNPIVNIASWLPSLAAEGGPPPEEVLPDSAAELAAIVCGYFAARAGLPPPATAPRVRGVQLSQLRIALPWAARTLGLPPPAPAY